MARILTMSDHPALCTGMGRVHREIALGLHNRGHHVEALGWFASMDRPKEMPFTVYQTANQFYGADRFDEIVAKAMPEVVITIGDAWMVSHVADAEKCKTRSRFQWLQYTPIDGAAFGEVVPPTWKHIYRDADVLIAYTEYGKRIIVNSMPELAEEIRIIPHGVDTSIYHPLPAEQVIDLRRNIGIDKMMPNGEVERRVCYLVVARNQNRKNIPEIAKVWKKFTAKGAHPHARLWPHMVFQDQMGWNLDEIFDIMEIRPSMMYFDKVAHSPSNLKLMPEKDLNKLYNIADVFLLISGEGFGLPIVEAMACGKPAIVLDHSANSELVRGRGELVEVGHYVTGTHGTERPFPDRQSMLNALDRMYKFPERRRTFGEAALKFITEGDPDLYGGKPLTWESALDEWDRLIHEVTHPLSRPLKLREVC